MRNFVLSICVLAIFFTTSVPVEAASYSAPKTERERQELIIQLLREVLRLQALLAEKTKHSEGVREPYESVLFTLPIETIYFVEAGELVPAKGSTRTIDETLFNLFKDVLGESIVNTYVAEWRVFNVPVGEVDAAVESIGDSDRYVVNINRAGYDERSLVRQSFANLFIHEAAHLFLFERPEFVAEYTDTFWGAADLRHKEMVQDASPKRRAELLADYYDANTSRFVSEYATVSPDEDMAETFVTFVRSAKPSSDTVLGQKVLRFYTEPDFVRLRTDIRGNLEERGL